MKKCRSCGKWLLFPKKVKENENEPVFMCFGCFLIETIGRLVNEVAGLNDFIQDVDPIDPGEDGKDLGEIDAKLINEDNDWDLRKGGKKDEK